MYVLEFGGKLRQAISEIEGKTCIRIVNSKENTNVFDDLGHTQVVKLLGTGK